MVPRWHRLLHPIYNVLISSSPRPDQPTVQLLLPNPDTLLDTSSLPLSLVFSLPVFLLSFLDLLSVFPRVTVFYGTLLLQGRLRRFPLCLPDIPRARIQPSLPLLPSSLLSSSFPTCPFASPRVLLFRRMRFDTCFIPVRRFLLGNLKGLV